MKKTLKSNTEIGNMVEAVYETALEEYMDDVLAKRIAMQFLLRKLRLHDKQILKEQSKSDKPLKI